MTMTDWKKIFIRAAGFGAGLALTLLIGIAIWSYISSLPKKPKPWDNLAIKATFSEHTVNMGDHINASFRYQVENTTPFDYCLPNDSEVAFIRLPSTKGLAKDHGIAWDKGTCVPTGQKVAVSLRLTYDYNEYSFPKSDRDNLEKLSKFMNRRLSEIDGFVILDNQHRYQINFPKGWDDKNSDKTTQ